MTAENILLGWSCCRGVPKCDNCPFYKTPGCKEALKRETLFQLKSLLAHNEALEENIKSLFDQLHNVSAHGHWLYDEKEEVFICSECGMSALNDYKGQSSNSNGCPHCLAVMDGEVELIKSEV